MTETNNAQAAGVNTTEEPVTACGEETVSMSKAEYDKAIQSAEDKLRTKYSKEIKALSDKIAELTPVQKSEDEIAIEQRLAALEAKEKETAEKEKLLELKSALQHGNLSPSIADYLKTDVDTNAFIEAVNKLVNDKVIASGYKPAGHQSGSPVSKEDYNKMSYDEMAALYRVNPDARKRYQ